MNKGGMLVSIVIPCFNNESELKPLFSQIQNAVKVVDDTFTFEIIAVDDGSPDGTWGSICELAKDSAIPVHGLRLSQNIGAYYAILAGFDHAKGNAVLVMAADGDDPASLIPELLAKYGNGTDLVQANRSTSDKRALSRLASRFFLSLIRLLGAKNIPSGGSDLVLMSRSLIDKAEDHGWMSGNTLIQIFQHAEKVETIDYRKGRSKPSSWTFGKKISLFLSTLNVFLRWRIFTSAIPEREVVERC